MYLLEKLSGGTMSNKSKSTGFVVICDEKSGKILDMPPVNDETTKTEALAVDRSDPGNGKKHHLSNSGTKRPGCRR